MQFLKRFIFKTKPETEGQRFWRLYASGYDYRVKLNDKERTARSPIGRS